MRLDPTNNYLKNTQERVLLLMLTHSRRIRTAAEFGARRVSPRPPPRLYAACSGLTPPKHALQPPLEPT
eukprot:4007344-Pyramimonas_sp.AAC.2